jgi:hypothetical protein
MLISIGGALFGYSAPSNLVPFNLTHNRPHKNRDRRVGGGVCKDWLLRGGMLNKGVFIFTVDEIESTYTEIFSQLRTVQVSKS